MVSRGQGRVWVHDRAISGGTTATATATAANAAPTKPPAKRCVITVMLRAPVSAHVRTAFARVSVTNHSLRRSCPIVSSQSLDGYRIVRAVEHSRTGTSIIRDGIKRYFMSGERQARVDWIGQCPSLRAAHHHTSPMSWRQTGPTRTM